ncbi:MAG: (2Fe-2S)-binding protein [Alphaproteobacteria bacterium]|nr:(2Fe-2S)-binding protein [Alphaproteobacteria bacterium]
MVSLKINGRMHRLDVEPDMPLLWLLRDELNLTGTKYGCGVAACGACTVHVDGRAARSCQLAVGSLEGAEIVTIEGLGAAGLHRIQEAWIAEEVPQCGYCQTGMIMAAAALLAETARPDDAAIDAAIGNLCRCGTYARVRRAIHRAAGGG